MAIGSKVHQKYLRSNQEAELHVRLIGLCVCREQAAAEKQRRTPEAGRHVRVAPIEAMRMDDCCWSSGCPNWLMVIYAMLDDSYQLRLVNLTTGTTRLLLTVGGHPASPPLDDLGPICRGSCRGNYPIGRCQRHCQSQWINASAWPRPPGSCAAMGVCGGRQAHVRDRQTPEQ